MKGTIIICKRQMPKYITHCQLHGEPIEHERYLKVSFILPSGKVKQDIFNSNATDEQIIERLKSHPKNLKDYNFEFKKWEEVFKPKPNN